MSVNDALLLAIAIACGSLSCGSPPPGSVDGEEQIALDLEACIHDDPSCKKTPGISAVESIAPGTHAIHLDCTSSTCDFDKNPKCDQQFIDAPLIIVPGQKLQHLVVGLHTLGAVGDRRQLVVQIDDGKAALLDSFNVPGFGRVEIAELGVVPRNGARLHIGCTEGEFELEYVVGRWNP